MSRTYGFELVDSQVLNASDIVEDTSRLTSSVPVAPQNVCKMKTVVLQHGIEVMHWFAHFENPVDIPVLDDSGRVNFSFTSQLDGRAFCALDEGDGGYRLEENAACMHYGPGRLGKYRQHGTVRNLTVTVDPELLAPGPRDSDSVLNRLLRSGGFFEGYQGGELFATARLLSSELPLDGDTVRHPLWLQGQALVLVGLMLEASGAANGERRQVCETRRLFLARDRLLADLSCAPNLIELAKEVGLSVSTLTRGFRRQFGNSPYGMFQQERMQVARLRLQTENISVTSLAFDLGYSNVGHFSNAFRKQFGVLPSELLSNRSQSTGG